MLATILNIFKFDNQVWNSDFKNKPQTQYNNDMKLYNHIKWGAFNSPSFHQGMPVNCMGMPGYAKVCGKDSPTLYLASIH